MTGRGRPYIGRTIEVRLPDELRDALQAEAQCDGVTLAALIRDICHGWAAERDLLTQ